MIGYELAIPIAILAPLPSKPALLRLVPQETYPSMQVDAKIPLRYHGSHKYRSVT